MQHQLKISLAKKNFDDHGARFLQPIYRLGIAIPEFFSNPGISGLKNANPGIESGILN